MVDKISITAALICLASVTTAQTVTLGTFGYTRIDHPAGFSISGMQFINTTNTPDTIYADNLPTGSKIYKWNANGYDYSSYTQVWDSDLQQLVTKWTKDFDLENGQGYWVEASGSMEVILSGDVPMKDTITNSIVTGFQICSFPYPVDRVITNLGFSPSLGDKIYLWNGSGYDYSSYAQVWDSDLQQLVTKWTKPELPIAVGEGFWYDAFSDANWIVDRPY